MGHQFLFFLMILLLLRKSRVYVDPVFRMPRIYVSCCSELRYWRRRWRWSLGRISRSIRSVSRDRGRKVKRRTLKMSSSSLDVTVVVGGSGMGKVRVRRCGCWCGIEMGVWDSLGNDVLPEGWMRLWARVLESTVDRMKDQKLDLTSILYTNVLSRSISDGPQQHTHTYHILKKIHASFAQPHSSLPLPGPPSPSTSSSS